jgi:catechol 2,3-dioxygenase-like lactoylglutathione lyase family enzyme
MHADLTHVRLLVSDYPTCFGFYKDVLGLEVALGDEESSYAEFEAGSVRLALFSRKEMDAALGVSSETGTRAQDQVAVILRVDDVDRACSDLAAAGIELLTEPQDRPDWGIRTAHLRDPDGNLLELNKRLES